MRLTNVFGGRPAYYDRNSLDKSTGQTNSGTAPHGSTSRFTYTVPSLRAAFCTRCHASAIRTTAAGTSGRVRSRVFSGFPLGADARFQNNTVDFLDKQTIGSSDYLVAGDTVIGDDSDASTTGTCDFEHDAAIIEFDV